MSAKNNALDHIQPTHDLQMSSLHAQYLDAMKKQRETSPRQPVPLAKPLRRVFVGKLSQLVVVKHRRRQFQEGRVAAVVVDQLGDQQWIVTAVICELVLVATIKGPGDEPLEKRHVQPQGYRNAGAEDWAELMRVARQNDLRVKVTTKRRLMINFKFLLQPHQKYYITQYGELFIAYWDERWWYYQFSLYHLYISL